MSFSSKRYLGLELGGAKNQKTTLAMLEYYPSQGKIFLLDVFENIGGDKEVTGDQQLLDKLKECGSGLIGVNVPLSLPPCMTCTRKSCPLPERCTVPSVKWMRAEVKKSERREKLRISKEKSFTPYTQRPVEIWIRYKLMDQLQEKMQFEVDEALGGTKAPLTARMAFLQRHLKYWNLVEVSPKLTVATLAETLKLPQRVLSSYRNLEKGIHSRTLILEALASQYGVFIYEKESRRLASHLGAFNAFLSAFTACLSDTGKAAAMPKGFPDKQGWIAYPDVLPT